MANLKGYKKELDFGEDLAFRRFIEPVEKLINDEIDKKIKERKLCVLEVCTVSGVAIDNSTADVLLPGTTVSIPSLKNKTGETLNINDQVYIMLIGGDINNSFILIKK